MVEASRRVDDVGGETVAPVLQASAHVVAELLHVVAAAAIEVPGRQAAHGGGGGYGLAGVVVDGSRGPDEEGGRLEGLRGADVKGEHGRERRRCCC